MTINFVFRKKESTDTGLCFLNDKNLKDWNDWWFALREECPYSEFSGPHFPVFGLNIQSECGKMQTRITPNTDTLSAVLLTGIILIDLQKACDTMYHGILLGTLSIFFFSDNTVKWFRSYMSNGKFSLNFENSFSEVSNITCGVPQGYTWYLLFLIYVNNMTIKVKYNLYLRTMVHA